MRIPLRWAYEFNSNATIEQVPDILNKKGPWTWQLRDSYIHGIYANTRPTTGIHIKINEYPQGFILRNPEKRFASILEIDTTLESKEEVDSAFSQILATLQATQVKEIEPYD